MAVLWEDQPSTALPNMLAVARVRRGRRVGLLTDAFALPSFAHRFVTCLALGKEFASDDGVVRFQPTEIGRGPLDSSLKAEVNFLAAALDGKVTATNNVLPFTQCDLYSYSSWDIGFDPGVEPERIGFAAFGNFTTSIRFDRVEQDPQKVRPTPPHFVKNRRGRHALLCQLLLE